MAGVGLPTRIGLPVLGGIGLAGRFKGTGLLGLFTDNGLSGLFAGAGLPHLFIGIGLAAFVLGMIPPASVDGFNVLRGGSGSSNRSSRSSAVSVAASRFGGLLCLSMALAG